MAGLGQDALFEEDATDHPACQRGREHGQRSDSQQAVLTIGVGYPGERHRTKLIEELRVQPQEVRGPGKRFPDVSSEVPLEARDDTKAERHPHEARVFVHGVPARTEAKRAAECHGVLPGCLEQGTDDRTTDGTHPGDRLEAAPAQQGE